jgi:hypothetical protein
MPIAGGIALLVIGGILTFALTGSIQGLDLHVVGVILMLAGALALLLPWLVRARRRSNQVVAYRQDVVDDGVLADLPDNDLALEDQRRAQDRRRLWVRRG